ncbi:uncharacterized protein LOC117327954 [Pecten maximus]|uniref:uncharacterized protein LOC117327954 n=1 Tax=Pecten maximus TaxID=6579 RepID=UPI001458B911|nr:uncharacterized protein LOC117327954 [Pecten maximus]
MAHRFSRANVLGRILICRQNCCTKQLVRPVVAREFHVTPNLGGISNQTYTTPEIKQLLVRTKFFKKVEHVPDFVGSGLVSLAHDFFRVRMFLTIMNVLFFIIYLMFMWVRRKKTKEFVERTNIKYDAHRSRELDKNKLHHQD